MHLALLILAQAAAEAPAPPADWSALAPVPYAATPAVTAQLSRFVADEVTAGRCTIPRPGDGHYLVKVDVAAWLEPDGVVKRAVPRAIACPTVEQYSAGLVTSFARGNIKAKPAPGWYRTTITFDWRQ